MKSNPSPSAPLNLCPPTGVTGTVLPASPEGVACVPALIKGEHYDVSSLSFVGWTDGDGTGHEGYNVADYFRGSIYLGPDDHGIEPIANLPSPAEPVKVPASPVKDTPTYHPDPSINAEVIEQANEAERVDLAAGFPPSTWTCPQCSKSHNRGHFGNIGSHRCLSCGYVGGEGVLSHAPASPVDSVGVSESMFHFMERSVKRCADPIDHDGELYGVIQCPEFALDVYAPVAMEMEAFKSTLRAFTGNAASHAAKDAKIREADEILKRCAMWLGKMIADGGHMQCVAPNDCVRTLERVEAFRAALALPCAPLGS